MKEIKFRAWNEEQKKMWWFDLLWGNTTAQGSGWIGMVESPEDGKYRNGGDNRVQVDPMDKIIMQCTGLKDKNGKECYFDDLVKWGKSTYQVIWDSDEGVAWLRKISGEEIWSKLRIHLVQDGEIIGNVYEDLK